MYGTSVFYSLRGRRKKGRGRGREKGKREAIKGVGRPARLFPHAKMLLIPISLFLSAPSPFSLPPYPLPPTPFDACYAGQYLFHFFINSARFRKKWFLFFSFVVRFRLVIRFYSHFFGLLVRFFPQHQVFQQKRLYSSCQAFLISSCNLILFSGENIACCTWNTFAVLQTSLR